MKPGLAGRATGDLEEGDGEGKGFGVETVALLRSSKTFSSLLATAEDEVLVEEKEVVGTFKEGVTTPVGLRCEEMEVDDEASGLLSMRRDEEREGIGCARLIEAF